MSMPLNLLNTEPFLSKVEPLKPSPGSVSPCTFLQSQNLKKSIRHVAILSCFSYRDNQKKWQLSVPERGTVGPPRPPDRRPTAAAKFHTPTLATLALLRGGYALNNWREVQFQPPRQTELDGGLTVNRPPAPPAEKAETVTYTLPKKEGKEGVLQRY